LHSRRAGAWFRQARYALFVVALACVAVLQGCYKYVVLPGETTYEAVSPPYLLRIVNGTGAPFVVECVPQFCGKPGVSNQTVGAGGSFELLMLVRRFRVAASDLTGSNQLLDAPYIFQDGAATGVVRVRHGGVLHELTVDLVSPKWTAQRAAEGGALPLPIELQDFNPKRWFIGGPP
jgi:hypothetical protein